MVHDHGRAEDITQDVFMSALRRMRDTDRPIIFKPWIYEIAKNACIDAFRRSKRAEEVSYDAEEGLGGPDYGRLVSSTPTPDAAVDTRMSLDHLRGAFGGLSEMHHDILVMRELEGLSYREIGQRLGMSRPSVESTLFRARRRLTEEYEELTSGERCQRVQGLIAESGGRRMGVRDERKLARHVSYCQPCRRAAYSAGFDVAALAAQKSLREKVAALLPIPAFFKRRWFGGDGHGHGGGSGSGSIAKLTSAASQYAEPMSGWAKAAAVAATVAVAGAGAGVATTHGTDRAPSAPRQAAPAGAGLQPATAASSQKQAAGAPAATGRAQGASTAASKSSSPSASRAAGAKRAGGGGSSSSSSTSKPSSSGGGAAGNGGGGTTAKGAAGGSSAGGGGTSPASNAARQTNGAAGKAVDKTAGAVNKTAGAVNQTVDKTAGAVNTTVNNTTGTAKDTVGAATGAVDKATNGATAPVTGAVNGTVGTATDAANSAAGAATGVVTGATNTATSAASDPVGTVTGATNDPVGTVTTVVGGVLPGG